MSVKTKEREPKSQAEADRKAVAKTKTPKRPVDTAVKPAKAAGAKPVQAFKAESGPKKPQATSPKKMN